MVWQGGQKFEQKQFERRVSAVLISCFVLFSLLIFRLFYLQIIRGAHFNAISESNRTQVFIQKAARGVIYDTNHNVLVDNKPTSVVLFSPLELEEDVFDTVIDSLSTILNIPHKKLMSMVGGRNKSSVIIRLADEIPRDVLFQILEARPNLPGVTINIEPARRYPYKEWASHLFGHLGEINARELSKRIHDGYKLGDIIGKSGIEKVYDYYVRGKSGGMQLEIDATGKSQRILYEIPSIPGNDVILNIDKNIQQAAEEMFKKNNFTGAAVAIDPSNGKVRALVSVPNYDPNIFLKPLNREQSKQLFSSSANLMFNRAVQGKYALGSVFKIITMISALEAGAALTTKTIRCHGVFKLGRQEFKCWLKKGHGKVDLLGAITRSCNVYFAQLGLEAGLESIVRYSRLFGFGELTGIDLPVEKKGLMPDKDWKKKKFREIWYKGDTVNLAIGQGFLLVTPLQTASMMAAVASKGKLFRPYVLDTIVDGENNILLQGKTQLIRQINLTAETWDTIDNGLKNVVNNGTGRASRIRGLEIAGKTGTVQNPHGEDHAWFGAYASMPDEFPRIAVAVLVEHGKHGASAAAPIARAMIHAAFPEIKK